MTETDPAGRGPSLASILRRRGAELALQPVVLEPQRAARPVADPRTAGLTTLAGHLNLVQPNRIQVLGTTEIRFWTSRDEGERARLLDALFDADPCAVIVADGLEPPPDILERAGATGRPLLRAGADCERVIRALRHDLGHALAPRAVRHGVFLDVLGVGVLLAGPSTVGKSELALELVSRGHSLVADDAPEFHCSGPDTVEGEAPPILRDFLEVSGLGVLNIRAMYGDAAIRIRKRLQLIIHLEALNAVLREHLDRLDDNLVQTDFLGVEIDAMTLPVAPGRNLAVLAEAAVRNFLLIRRGYRAGDDLRARQATAMTRDDPDRCA